MTGSVVMGQLHEMLMLSDGGQYSDTAIHCRDGTVFFNRVVVDLIFPWLAAALQQTIDSDLALLLPDYQKEDLVASLEAVLTDGNYGDLTVIKEEPPSQPMDEEEEYGGQQFEGFPEIKEYEDVLEVDGAFTDGGILVEGGGPFISEVGNSHVGNETIPTLTYYYCNECQYGTSLTEELQSHFKKVHNKKRYPCKYCEYIATETGSLKRHTRSKHEKHEQIKIPCSQCEYKANSNANLKTHVQSMHENIIHSCNFCNYKTRHSTSLSWQKKSQRLGT